MLRKTGSAAKNYKNLFNNLNKFQKCMSAIRCCQLTQQQLATINVPARQSICYYFEAHFLD